MDTHELGFLSEAVAEPRPEQGGAPPPEPQAPLNDRETAGFYHAMQEERDKRQALERQLADLRAANTEPRAAPTERDIGVTVYANNLRVSRRFAERDYGREVVAAVHNWAAAKCDTDPAFNQTMRASDDPYEAAKQAYDREESLRNERSAPPPRSLADAPGNGAVGKPHVPVGDGNAYDSLFN